MLATYICLNKGLIVNFIFYVITVYIIRYDWAAYFAVGPVTLTAILFPHPKNSDAMKLRRIFQVPMKTRPFSAGVNF